MKMNKSSFKRILAGLLTGIVNGLFGGGGGMVVVPLMKNMLGYEEKYAHATAILVIAPVCAASLVTYIVNGYFSAEVILPAAVGSVAGGLLGAELLDKLPAFWVNAVFLAVMLAAGLRMLFLNAVNGVKSCHAWRSQSIRGLRGVVFAVISSVAGKSPW